MPQIKIYIFANSSIYLVQLVYSLIFMKWTSTRNLYWQLRVNYLVFLVVLIVTVFGIMHVWSSELQDILRVLSKGTITEKNDQDGDLISDKYEIAYSYLNMLIWLRFYQHIAIIFVCIGLFCSAISSLVRGGSTEDVVRRQSQIVNRIPGA